MKPPSKILIALQYWEGDRSQAMRVARLMADLEPKLCEIADFLFCARFDCEHDLETINYVSKKFTTYHFINRNRRGQGWPFGCNELWFGTMTHILEQTEAGNMPQYKAILTCEADSFPLCPGWLEVLHSEWDEKKAQVVGVLLNSPLEHVNGNALFSGDYKFLDLIARKISGCTPMGGWDAVLAPTFKKLGWANSYRMRSWWGYKTMPKETYDQLLGEKVVFFHGCKDNTPGEYVRARFLS